MKNFLRVIPFLFVLIALILLGWWLLKDVHMDVLEPRGEVAGHQKQLLIFTVALSAVVVIPVFTLLGIFAFRFRETNNTSVYRPEWDNNKILESIWWGIPIIIIAILAVVTWQTSHSLDPYKKIVSDTKPVQVQVVAMQWKWLFIYPELGVATLNQLPIPVETPIEFTLTSDAAMNAFWVPSLGSQIYAMNGMSSKLNLIADSTGDFNGYTTNINGKGYADMKFIVHSQTKRSFEDWLIMTRLKPEAMDVAAYTALARQGVMKDERSYRLTDRSLYGTIIDKYMGVPHTETMPAESHDSMSRHDAEAM